MVENCKTCGKEVNLVANDSVHSSTYDTEICFECLQNKFEKPTKCNFMLKISPITENERDVILNGIAKNDFFDDYVNGAVWTNEVIDNCEIVSPAQIQGLFVSLHVKGLITYQWSGDASTVRLTAEGYLLYLNNR